MEIQFFKREDGSSLNIVGDALIKLLKRGNKFQVNVKSVNKYVSGQTIEIADVGIACGLITDLYLLQHYSRRIASLVCEKPLTLKEIELLQEAKLDNIWVPSQYVKQQFQNAGFKKLSYIPYGIDRLLPSPINPGKRLRVGMVFTSHQHANFHVVRKGIFETLQAIGSMENNVTLVLRTDNKSYYSKYIKDLKNVEFVSYVRNMKDFYDDVDIILTPSKSEGFGLIGMEALAYGIPLISTKTGNDYLDEDTSYYHLDKVTADNIHDAILNVINHYPSYAHKATNQRECFIEKNAWEFKYQQLDRSIRSIF